jgi:hypothetical protein
MGLRNAMIPTVFRAPLLLACAAVALTPLLLAPGERAHPPQAAMNPPQADAATPGSVTKAETQATHSYAYYPEQLAALSSLNGFQPLADPGRPTIAASAAPAQGAASQGSASQGSAGLDLPATPAARKIAREAQRRPAPVSAAAPQTPAAAPHADPEAWSVFGVKLPKPGWPDGDALRRQADNWRDAAGGQATALGDHIAHLWR